MTNNVLTERDQRLQDKEYRRDFGAATVKYDLAIALVEARTQAGLTQQQLAELCGVQQSYIAKLESGEANPTVGNIGGLLAIIWRRLRMQPIPLVTQTETLEDATIQSSGPSVLEDQILDGLKFQNPITSGEAGSTSFFQRGLSSSSGAANGGLG